MVRAGNLNCPVMLQHKTGGVDPIGQPLPEDWANYDMDWADIRFTSGLEAVRGGAETSIARASVRLRYRQDVTPAMRLIYENRIYNITAVLPDEAGRQHIDLVCEVVDMGVTP